MNVKPVFTPSSSTKYLLRKSLSFYYVPTPQHMVLLIAAHIHANCSRRPSSVQLPFTFTPAGLEEPPRSAGLFRVSQTCRRTAHVPAQVRVSVSRRGAVPAYGVPTPGGDKLRENTEQNSRRRRPPGLAPRTTHGFSGLPATKRRGRAVRGATRQPSVTALTGGCGRAYTSPNASASPFSLPA